MKNKTARLIFLFMFLINSHSLVLAGIPYEHTGTYLIPESQEGFMAEQYEMEAGKKLSRGLKNFFLGWLEVPQGIKREFAYRNDEYLPAGIETFVIGAFKGTGRAAGRMAVGFYEAFTFPYPQRPIMSEMDEWLY